MSASGGVVRENGNVTILAPAAVRGTRDLESLKARSPGEYAQELEKQINKLMLERSRDKVALDTFSTVIAAFVKLASPDALEAMIDRSVVDRMDGANVTINEVPGSRDVVVRVRERAPHPLWEGRHG